MNKKNLKVVSFRMNKFCAAELKETLKNKSLTISNVFRRFTEKLLTNTEKVLDFLDE